MDIANVIHEMKEEVKRIQKELLELQKRMKEEEQAKVSQQVKTPPTTSVQSTPTPIKPDEKKSIPSATPKPTTAPTTTPTTTTPKPNMPINPKITTDFRNACMEGNLVLVKKLISEGADVNAKLQTSNLSTPLLNACARGHEKVVACLLENGADITIGNQDGETAIHIAIKHNFVPLVEFLLSHGSTINETDNQDNTPLHHASMAGHVRIVQLLLKKGADKNLKNDSGKKPASVAKSQEVGKIIDAAK